MFGMPIFLVIFKATVAFELLTTYIAFSIVKFLPLNSGHIDRKLSIVHCDITPASRIN